MDNWKRPRLHIPKTKSEQIWDLVGYLFFIGSVLLLVVVWSHLPDQVPAHFNFKGEVDRYGSKYELIILPVIGLFTMLLLLTFEKHPEMHNYPKRFNESNAAQFYLHSRKMLNQLKNITLILVAILPFESVSMALGWTEGMGWWFVSIPLIAMVISITVGVIRQRKIK